MRTITLYNGSDGHDKVYQLVLTQFAPGDRSFRVTAKGGRRDSVYGDYGISPGAQTEVKLQRATLVAAIRYIEEKILEKQSRGYRVVSRRDDGAVFSVPVAPVVNDSIITGGFGIGFWRDGRRITLPVQPELPNRDGRPEAVQYPQTCAYRAAIANAIHSGNFRLLRDIVAPPVALDCIKIWHLSLIEAVEGRPASPLLTPRPALANAPAQSRRSLGAVRAAATRRRNREARVAAGLPAAVRRPATISDDCGGNPVAVGAICAADYWKR